MNQNCMITREAALEFGLSFQNTYRRTSVIRLASGKSEGKQKNFFMDL